MKYALVTGGSRGLGRSICYKLSQMGIPVLINFQSNQSAAEETKKFILQNGGIAELIQFNVGNEFEVSSSIETWEQSHPNDYIAYLINNAGIRKDNLMFMMPEQDWHDVINISLNGFYYVTRKLLPKMMMRKHGGRIINVASLSGIKGMPGQTNYSAAKAALIGATKALALEVAVRNVTVNAVAPGFIETDISTNFKSTGINQTLHRINLKIKVDVNINVGTLYQTETVETEILLAETVLVGNVPDMYIK